jgi:FkbM family methyltransferase
VKSGILKLVVALAAVGVLVYWYPPFRLSALVAAGRSPDCPLSQAVKAEDNLKREIEIKDRILKASKRVEVDAQGYTLWDTPKGRYWVPKGSDYVLPFNLAEQERKIYGEGKHFVQPGDVVLDCGANMGVFTRVALDHGARLVVAIEPAPENLEVLKRNFAAEIAAGKVILYPKGVWDKDDVLSMNIDADNSAADSFVLHPDPDKSTTIQLPLTTIDKLVSELKLDKVDFVKMDIEGAEPNALRGGKETIAKYHPRMAISVYHKPGDPVEVTNAIHSAWPEVTRECGPCEKDSKANVIRPDIYYFY